MATCEIIDLTRDEDAESETRVVIRNVLRAAIARVAAQRVPAMFLSKSAIQRGGTEAPCLRLTTQNLPRLGLRGGTRFWAIDGAPNADAIRDRLREYEVLALDEVPAREGSPDGMSEILSMCDVHMMSDAVMRGTDFFGADSQHRCEVAVFFTKSRRQPGDPDGAVWTAGDGAVWTVHRWWGAFDGDGDVAPERGLAHFLFVLGI